ncbi:MAG: DNA-deoxyinosine glycosylase [Muribaculaceae bacterium]|nr:DNA-deoxyinosine glycosylase [Roseburia sp.]MCM1429970.1 DNA-deoxyinosine glycosylase [Muribaculaceae bacterium]MCM1493003.1 DNA-deoxyinosine glycosylase [Muribaculaceae bacterium]
MPVHNIPPVYDARSAVLILGSFPSVKSREQQFFYGHKQNRFWRVLSRVLDSPEPQSIPEKKELLLSHGIAVWDVIASCSITGSSDASIQNVIPNDITRILEAADIQQIFSNGGKSYELYRKYLYPQTGREAIKLPSTSPANAAFSVERLAESWAVIRQYAIV